MLGQCWEDAFKISTSDEAEPAHSTGAVLVDDEDDDDWA